MDISFARIERGSPLSMLPGDLAILMVGVASRQAACPTARLQTRLNIGARIDGLLCPVDGSFNAMTASALTKMQQE